MMQWLAAPVYVHRAPVDFRKSINGLVVIVQEAMLISPFAEALFVFGRFLLLQNLHSCHPGNRNRHRDKIKILYWDKNGFCLWYKRLEQDKFKWPRSGDTVLHVSAEQFSWLLRGLDIAKLTPHAAQYYSVTN